MTTMDEVLARRTLQSIAPEPAGCGSDEKKGVFDYPEPITHVIRELTREDSRKMEIPHDWTFKNQSVADNFDRHVREQLPWYDMATGMVAHFGRHYLPEGGVMYDLGSSTGNITRMLKDEIEKRKIEVTSIDSSEEMAKVFRGVGKMIVGDVREVEILPYDFCTCFLLLMFLPPVQQVPFLHKLISKIKQGGCLVLFDKVETADGYLGTVLHRLTLAGKVATGVTADEIVRKELSLAGQQRPINEQYLNFTGVVRQQVFRFGEFVGYVFIR